MSAADNGGPAFPHVGTTFNHDYGEREAVTTEPGVTVRDYFAAKAMQALVQTPMCEWPEIEPVSPSISTTAYRIADEMLKARAL